MEMFGKLEDMRELLDVESNATVFYEQINNEEEDYTSPKVDHFSDIYNEYMNLLNSDEDLPQDSVSEIVDQFTQICTHIINYINQEFNTDIEVNSLMDSSSNLPGITKAVYIFFIIDFYNNIYQILKNYINKHSDDLYTEFSELDQKKDVMTSSYKKNGFSNEISTIASNIYDITDYIFSKLDGGTALEYCEPDNLPAQVMKKLVKDSQMSDEYLVMIADIYKKNVNLRARICFEIVFAIKNGDIEDRYKTEPSIEE